MMLSSWPRVTLGSARVEHPWSRYSFEIDEADLSDPPRKGPAFEAAHLRQVFSAYPTGVVALAAIVEAQPVGIVASSFVSVSLAPPLVSFCAAHTSATWPLLRRADRIGISILTSDQEQASRSLAAREPDRFANLDWRATPSGAVILNGSSAWLECAIYQVVRAGDHDIVMLRVMDMDSDMQPAPLVFHGSTYRRLAQ